MTRRQVRLTYVNTGESVTAEMLDDEATQVCELVWHLLPVETKVIHGMYSGAEVFAMIDNPQPAPAQNMVQLPLPGELLYFYDASTGAVGARKPVAEICVVYGRGVVVRAHEGVPTHCSLFARINVRLNKDCDSMVAQCSAIQQLAKLAAREFRLIERAQDARQLKTRLG